jgi:diguanylate cyclase (GGDEF)-like protein
MTSELRSGKNGLYSAGILLIADSILLSPFIPRRFSLISSNAIELLVALLVFVVIQHTANRCSGYIKGVWQLIAVCYFLFAAAEVLWFFAFLYPANQPLQVWTNFLLDFWFMPLGIAILLQPDSLGKWLNLVLLTDVVQAILFAAASYYCFIVLRVDSLARLQFATTSPFEYFLYYAILIGAFFLRSFTSRAGNRRALFRQLAIFLSLSCLLDAIDSSGLGLHLSSLFELRYSVVLCVPLTFVLSWNSGEDSVQSWEAGQARYSRITLLLPLIYPTLILCVVAQRSVSHPLFSWTMIALSFAVSATRQLLVQGRLLKTRKTLEHQATHDGLTGTWNRTSILNILTLELERAERLRSTVGVIVLDLDFFKEVNDNYGHLAGDQLLRVIARKIITNLRLYDALGRYGGEEFVIVVPGCNLASTARLAGRIREAVEFTQIEYRGQLVGVTASLGVTIGRKHDSVDDLLQQADVACYRAKEGGRNRICVSGSEVYSEELEYSEIFSQYGNDSEETK